MCGYKYTKTVDAPPLHNFSPYLHYPSIFPLNDSLHTAISVCLYTLKSFISGTLNFPSPLSHLIFLFHTLRSALLVWSTSIRNFSLTKLETMKTVHSSKFTYEH